jgi:hypothetical protein
MTTEDERRQLLLRVEAVLRSKAAREAARRERIARTRAERDATTTMLSVRVPKVLRDKAARTLRNHDLTFSDAVRALLATMAESENDDQKPRGRFQEPASGSSPTAPK